MQTQRDQSVETKVNGDSKSTNERGPSLVGSMGSSCTYKRLLSCLCLLWSAQYKIFFFSPYTILIYVFPPIAQQPGQAVVRGRLSLNVWSRSKRKRRVQ
jgi:hypothetical protein